MNKKRQSPDEASEAANDPTAEAELVADGDVQPAEGGAAAGNGADKRDEEVAALKDQLLRLAADFDNFRKRARKEQDEIRRYGIESAVHDFLPVLDNLERALAHGEGDKNPVLQGVRMVQKQLADALSRHGVTSFPSVGKAFDPEKHEAVSQQPSDEKPGTILQELQRGYMLHDRLLRPARVVVAAAAPKEEADSADQARQGN